MSLQDTPRLLDDQIVFAMAERQRGVKLKAVAVRLGIAGPYLSASIQRVKAADIKECGFWGDDPSDVKAAYQ